MQWCRGRLGTDANLPADAPARLHGGPNAFHQPPHSHGITAPDSAGHMRRTKFFSKRLGMGKNMKKLALKTSGGAKCESGYDWGGSKCKVLQLSASYPLIPGNHANIPNLFKISALYTSSTAQGGGGSFKNRKLIGEVGCCESRMAERIH